MVENELDNSPLGQRRGMDIPELRRIDLKTGLECLLLGLRDFSRAPKYGLFFGGIYMLGGWLVLWLLFALNMPYLAVPSAIGFAFIAPFIAAGVYEVSRRLEVCQPLSWEVVLGTAWQQKGRDMGWMALITGFAFFIWIDYTAISFLLFFGLSELEISAFLKALVSTESGLYFMLLGNFVALAIGTSVFSVTVISFPLLLDREIDFATAMTTSVKAVLLNLLPMLVWAVIIAVCLLVAVGSVFVLLPMVLPVLGHGTWHMYRKVVTKVTQPEAVRL